MNKYCVVETDDKGNRRKVSRFFNTQHQAKLRVLKPNQTIMTKVSCIEHGLYTKTKRKSILRHIDMSEVKGLSMDKDTYPQDKANTENQIRYIQHCIQNGYIVPVLSTVL